MCCYFVGTLSPLRPGPSIPATRIAEGDRATDPFSFNEDEEMPVWSKSAPPPLLLLNRIISLTSNPKCVCISARCNSLIAQTDFLLTVMISSLIPCSCNFPGLGGLRTYCRRDEARRQLFDGGSNNSASKKLFMEPTNDNSTSSLMDSHGTVQPVFIVRC